MDSLKIEPRCFEHCAWVYLEFPRIFDGLCRTQKNCVTIRGPLTIHVCVAVLTLEG